MAIWQIMSIIALRAPPLTPAHDVDIAIMALASLRPHAYVGGAEDGESDLHGWLSDGKLPKNRTLALSS